jgi:hypothetical protein
VTGAGASPSDLKVAIKHLPEEGRDVDCPDRSVLGTASVEPGVQLIKLPGEVKLKFLMALRAES